MKFLDKLKTIFTIKTKYMTAFVTMKDGSYMRLLIPHLSNPFLSRRTVKDYVKKTVDMCYGDNWTKFKVIGV